MLRRYLATTPNEEVCCGDDVKRVPQFCVVPIHDTRRARAGGISRARRVA